MAQPSRRKYLKYIGGAAIAAAAIVAGYSLWPRPRAPVPTPTVTTPAETVIKLGSSSGRTGPLAQATLVEEHIQTLWAELVNADGGIEIKEYGRKLPVTWVFYNDNSEVDKYIRNVKRMVEIDKVHAIFGSEGTWMSFAIDPVIRGWDITLCAGGAGPAVIEDPTEFERIYREKDFYRVDGRPWYELGRQCWQEAHRYFHMEALVDVLKQVGVSTVIIWEIGTLYGIFSRRYFLHHIKDTGIKVLARREHPMEMRDFTSLVMEAEKLKPDAIIHFCYWEDGMAAIKDMIERDYNPNLLYSSFGGVLPAAFEKFGGNLDGIMYHACGAFPKSPVSKSAWGPGIKINNLYMERFGERFEPANAPLLFATCQVLGELIRRAGTLNRRAIWEEVIKTKDNPIETVAGPLAWHRGVWPETPGVVGQLQGVGQRPPGEDYEIIAAAFGDSANLGLKWNKSEWISAKPLYPKPKWKK